MCRAFSLFLSLTYLEFKDDIIQKYEVGLSQLLLAQGFKMDSYVDYAIGKKVAQEQIFSKVLLPLIKTSSVKGLKSFILNFRAMIFCVAFY